MKVKWDNTCKCEYMVVSQKWEQYRVLVLKECESHKWGKAYLDVLMKEVVEI